MKFNSKPIPEHREVPLADEGLWEKVVSEWTLREPTSQKQQHRLNNDCYVLSVCEQRDPLVQKAQLAEIVSLVKAQGDNVVGQEVYYLSKKHPRTLLGKGTSREIASRAHEHNANLLVIDAELTPSQMRNLEDMAGIAICDREAVILNVFLKHASTRRSKIQVEIAQLEYLRPRIRGIGIDMDQQTGGISGSRGAGETASELLARKLDKRLAELKKAQSKLEQADGKHRQQRDTCKRISLVGYTNAGKTSLMNALTSEQLSARDMPFETLDTTSRCLSRHGGDIIISDTVGFIRRLPQNLLASFETTLAEIRESSLLMIVVDAADYEWQKHLETTVEMLEKLKAQDIPRFYVFNKMDCLQKPHPDELLQEISEGYPYTTVSSRDETSVLQLKETLLQMVRSEQQNVELFVPYTASQAMSLVYSKCRVLENEAMESGLRFMVQAEPQIISQIQHQLKELQQ